MRDKIKPTLVLTVICIISALVLVLAFEATKESIAAQQQEKFRTSVQALFGDCEYNLIEDNFGADEVKAIAVTSDKKTAFRICADGYSKGGIEVLIGIDENGTVCGIEFVSLGETPGLGTKIRDIPDFRQQFIGADSTDYQFDAISGASYSSKGMKHAVDTAIQVYSENREAILNG